MYTSTGVTPSPVLQARVKPPRKAAMTMHDARRPTSWGVLSAGCIVAFCMTGALPADAEYASPLPGATEQPELSGESWGGAVLAHDPEHAIIRYDLDRFVEHRSEERRVGDECGCSM